MVDTLPEFASRGVTSSRIGNRCLRLNPERDATHGFFVACFRRKHDTDAAVVVDESEDSKAEVTIETSNDVTNVSKLKSGRKRQRKSLNDVTQIVQTKSSKNSKRKRKRRKLVPVTKK